MLLPHEEYGLLNELTDAADVPVLLNVAAVISPCHAVPVVSLPVYIV
jgi:hypothetical protein